MPEYPEIISRTKEMQQALCGLRIEHITVLQEKCLNVPVESLIEEVLGQTFQRFSSHGKWIIAELDKDTLLINLGMGGEILHLQKGAHLPEKKRIIIKLNDESTLMINFWWFGYFHLVYGKDLSTHQMISKLGPDAMQITFEEFQGLLNAKQRIKTLLLDQKKIAGIGNFYIHDILFKAGIHPLLPANQLSEADSRKLYEAMRSDLQKSANKGGAFYEQNLWGEMGNFQKEEIVVGYKDGQPCPVCQNEIKKIQTGSTTSYICEQCQPLEK